MVYSAHAVKKGILHSAFSSQEHATGSELHLRVILRRYGDILMLSSMHIHTKELSSAKYTLYFVYENTPAELEKCLEPRGPSPSYD